MSVIESGSRHSRYYLDASEKLRSMILKVRAGLSWIRVHTELYLRYSYDNCVILSVRLVSDQAKDDISPTL